MFGRQFRPGRTVTVALAVALTTAALAPSASAGIGTGAPSVAPPATSAVTWTACRDGFQCATVRVPLDYDTPAGAKI